MPEYDAYLLRLWRSTGSTGRQFAGRIEHLGKGEITQFTDLEALLQHIRRVAGVASVGDRDTTDDQPPRDPANSFRPRIT